MQRERYNLRYLQLGAYAFGALLLLSPEISRADESGVSFWVPGLFGSLAATPQQPGWSLAISTTTPPCPPAPTLRLRVNSRLGNVPGEC